MKLKLLGSLLVLGAMSSLSVVSAQSGDPIEVSKSAAWVLPYGPSLAGGNLAVHTVIEGTYDPETEEGQAYARGTLTKNARLFSHSAQVAKLTAEAWLVRSGPSFEQGQEFRIELLNNLVSWVEETPSVSIVMPPLNMLPGSGVTMSVPIGPLSLSVKGNAGVRSQMQYGAATSPETASAQLGGFAQAWALGTASASISAAGLVTIGVSADLRFGNLTATVALEPSMESVEGTLSTSLQPISVDVDVWLKIYYFFGSKKWTKELFDWGCSPIVSSVSLL
jgi:hypothetical protein